MKVENTEYLHYIVQNKNEDSIVSFLKSMNSYSLRMEKVIREISPNRRLSKIQNIKRLATTSVRSIKDIHPFEYIWGGE